MSGDRPLSLKGAAAVFGFALAVRLLFCFVAIPYFQLPIGQRSRDFFELTDGYIDLAVTLAEHHRFAFGAEAPPTTYRAPVFPIVLAGAYLAGGDIVSATLWVNCLASAATCVLVYAIAARLLGGRVSPRVMLLTCLFPLSVYYCASSYSDTVFVLTAVAYFLSLLWVVSRPSLASGGISGVALALSAMTKGVMLPFPVFFLAYSWRWAPAAVRAAMISLAVGLAVTSLWTIRNYKVSGHVVPVSGGLGFNVLVGNHMADEGPDPGTSYVYGEEMARRRVSQNTGEELTRAGLRTGHHLDLTPQLDRQFGQAGWRMIAENPWLLPKKTAVNTWRFWTFSSSTKKTIFNAVLNLATLLCAALTLRRLLPARRAEVVLVLLFIAYFVIVYAVLIVHSCRFCLPVVLLLTPLASAAVLLPRKQWRETPATETAAEGRTP